MQPIIGASEETTLFKRNWKSEKFSCKGELPSPVDIFPPAHPGDSRCRVGRRRSGPRALCSPPVTGIAVASAVIAMTGDVTTVICGCAGRGRHCARCDHRGRSPLAESPGPWPGPQPLAALPGHQPLAAGPQPLAAVIATFSCEGELPSPVDFVCLFALFYCCA